jgi:hypothetical protein
VTARLLAGKLLLEAPAAVAVASIISIILMLKYTPQGGLFIMTAL